MSGKERIRQFLLEHQGEVVTVDQVREAAGISSAQRRLRELREDEGWPIRSNIDERTLKPGEYRLEGDPPPPSPYRISRRISGRVRAQVLERNGYTCQMCGAGPGDPDPRVPARTVRLHIGHIRDRDQGGGDELTNLRALCSTCNQGARNLVQEPPSWAWLLGQLRRATIVDQHKALEWLRSRLEESGGESG